jgi:hypothetical protein
MLVLHVEYWLACLDEDIERRALRVLPTLLDDRPVHVGLHVGHEAVPVDAVLQENGQAVGVRDPSQLV